jgi:cation diffusion facilitator CzcD-associated flavoprotein CzcO
LWFILLRPYAILAPNAAKAEESTMSPEKHVLIIGAGPAGIASAYALQQARIPYQLIDRAETIASTWANQYPSLSLNTTRFYSHMPKKRFPLHWGIFPKASLYHQYLLDFVAEHRLNIQLGVEVLRVAPEGEFWRVESSTGTKLYRAVILATGVWGNPIVPQIEGMDTFQGELYHAHDFRKPEQVAGKRVLVVGNGPSGIDIAVASGEVAQTAIAIRSGIKLLRRYPYGLPQHAWLMLADLLPKAWCRKLMAWVDSAGYGDTSHLGLKPGAGGMTAYRGEELIKAVKSGKVKPLPAPIRFFEHEVKFADGSCQPFDVVIMATGYQPVLQQFLDINIPYSSEAWQKISVCDWETGENGQRGWPLRDVSEHPNGRQIMGYPGLYLVGTFYKGKGAMYNFNLEAEVAAQQIKKQLAQKP